MRLFRTYRLSPLGRILLSYDAVLSALVFIFFWQYQLFSSRDADEILFQRRGFRAESSPALKPFLFEYSSRPTLFHFRAINHPANHPIDLHI